MPRQLTPALLVHLGRKCLMLVLFQRKIIYLPSVPPGTRSESLADGERTPQLKSLLSGLRWKERSITSSAPTRWLRQSVQLKAIELEWKGLEKGKAKSMSEPNKALESSAESCAGSHLVVVYLQGEPLCIYLASIAKLSTRSC